MKKIFSSVHRSPSGSTFASVSGEKRERHVCKSHKSSRVSVAVDMVQKILIRPEYRKEHDEI